MTIQLVNIFEKFLFKRYSKNYGIFHELFAPDLIGLEVRNIDFEKSQFLKKFFLEKQMMSYQRENEKGTYDFLTIGTLSALREIVAESVSTEHNETQILIQKKIRNYSGDNHNRLLLLEKMGLSTESVIAMGILNVTPDSFSDGGKYFDKEAAVKHALEMLEEGADIIDVGGASTRPGAKEVSYEEERERTIPVIEAILKEKPDTIISIDTTKSKIAKEALEVGAKIVNDISAGLFDDQMFTVVKEFDATLILMHIKGTPENMQDNPYYTDVVNEIYEFLETRIEEARKSGVDKIVIDPGIGFGKRLEDNYEIIARLSEFKSLGYPLLIGLSRKSMLGNALKLDVSERDVPTVITESFAVKNGADIVRTHNVAYFNYLKKINTFLNNPTLLQND